MSKLINLVLIFLLFGLTNVNAQENVTNTDPGITPDNFLWGLDKAMDHISLLLTISPDAKASKGLEIAQERLAEIKLMVKENKIEAAQKSEEDHNSLLNVVKESISEINETNSSNTIKKIVKIEKELENQENEIERVNDQIKVKIKIKGTLTAEQKILLQAFLNSLDNSTQQVKLEINEKKNEVKAEIKQETGKSKEEVEQEIDDEENNQGLTDSLKEKAQEKISDLKQKIEELRNVNSTTKEFIEATDLLEQAQSEFDKGNYQAAINIAKLGKNKLESIEENEDEEN
ncbi:MAG: DUF5667 domain-containing protein, partial [Nanoarchaeota archaeon]